VQKTTSDIKRLRQTGNNRYKRTMITLAYVSAIISNGSLQVFRYTRGVFYRRQKVAKDRRKKPLVCAEIVPRSRNLPNGLLASRSAIRACEFQCGITRHARQGSTVSIALTAASLLLRPPRSFVPGPYIGGPLRRGGLTESTTSTAVASCQV